MCKIGKVYTHLQTSVMDKQLYLCPITFHQQGPESFPRPSRQLPSRNSVRWTWVVLEWWTHLQRTVYEEAQVSQSEIFFSIPSRLTRLSVFHTFALESTTEVVELVPILADPTQWLEFIFELPKLFTKFKKNAVINEAWYKICVLRNVPYVVIELPGVGRTCVKFFTAETPATRSVIPWIMAALSAASVSHGWVKMMAFMSESIPMRPRDVIPVER